VDQTGIFNAALGRIGSGDFVGAPTDRTVAAQTCNRFYDACRQEVLRAFPWPFAMRSVALVQVADYDIPGWGYVYQTPDNSLRILAVTDESGLRWYRSWYTTIGGTRNDAWSQPHVPWQIALRDDAARQVIVTDIESAFAFYTYDVTNTGALSPDFASVLAWRLAMEIGGPLKATRSLVDGAEARYMAWLGRAQATAFNESRDDDRPDSPSISARS
jgi:hypothetical protein